MLRSSYANFRPSSPGPIVETRFVPSPTENGTIVNPSLVDVTDPCQSDNFPDPKDYTLQNLIAAGVKLDEIPSKILTPSDVATVNNALNSALESISKTDSEETPTNE